MTLEDRRKAYRYGISAEKLACAYLRCKGYRILAERYRNAMGEIDILARKGRTLVAIEVKARKTLEQCEESITPWKQQKIARAVEGLLSGQGAVRGLANAHQFDVRFDVIWVAPKRWPRHIRNAWRM
ncbi:MAG: YraN family protein [Pseudomonadota bacterium]|nr:YraN family protein [Pseudomonadota bacterium]